jgi:hypothetical protein
VYFGCETPPYTARYTPLEKPRTYCVPSPEPGRNTPGKQLYYTPVNLANHTREGTIAPCPSIVSPLFPASWSPRFWTTPLACYTPRSSVLSTCCGHVTHLQRGCPTPKYGVKSPRLQREKPGCSQVTHHQKCVTPHREPA